MTLRYIPTRDIYQVRNELHHSSVSVTEKYANFYSMEELESDFPSLVVPNSNFQGEVAPHHHIPLSPHTHPSHQLTIVLLKGWRR